MKLSVIYGSNREGRFCDTVAGWCLQQLRKRTDLELEVLDPLAMGMKAGALGLPGEELKSFAASIAASDAVLVITPEYNHSFPAVLKYLIDSCYQQWQHKPIAFVSYGGISGGIRAVQQLRQVFIELHGLCVHASLSFPHGWDRFDENGQAREPERANRALNKIVGQLHWWTQVLHGGKAAADQSYDALR